MSFGLVYWIIMLLWLFGVLWAAWGPAYPWWHTANGLVLFVLFLLLGWKVFGAPIHG
jgi:hypothetical protein